MSEAQIKELWNATAENDTVPVVIDDVKNNLEDFEMTRCVYLAVDYDGLQADWLVGQPLASRILLSEFAGVITGPEDDRLFTSPGQIDAVFEQLEQESEEGSFRWVIEFEDLWIPNRLIESVAGKAAPGTVLRVAADLVRVALRFGREQISLERYLELCHTLEAPIQASPAETRAFRAWGEEEIKRARDDFERLQEQRKVRPWQDADGNLYYGSERIEESEE